MIQPLSARFLTSASVISQAPAPQYSEVVFIGRSNVGKSTLINLITQTKGLAKSSSTPGKTQLINYFEAHWRRDDVVIPLWLVDLPGFGYAKVSKNMRQEWGEKLVRFLQSRKSIKLFIQLIDARHTDLAIDKQAWEMLQSLQRGDSRMFKVFTKMDKLNKNEQHKLKHLFSDACFVSMLSKEGVDELRERIIRDILGESQGEAH